MLLNTDDINSYRSCLKLALKGINIPSHTLGCQGLCGDKDHYKLIDEYYNKIVECIFVATDKYIPKIKSYTPHIVPGWVDYAKEKHDLARQAFVQWVYDGKPRCGTSYECMYRTRLAFKYALRFCQRNEAQLKADACANSLKNADSNQFWKTVRKISCKKPVCMLVKLRIVMAVLIFVICGMTTSGHCITLYLILVIVPPVSYTHLTLPTKRIV